MAVNYSLLSKIICPVILMKPDLCRLCSVLGPLLFIIFINDLVESCGVDANIYLFADDAKVYHNIF